MRALAPGLTARNALEKFAAVQMVDGRIPTTDRRELLLTRHTEPEPELELLLERLKLTLPTQPQPKISATQTASATLLLPTFEGAPYVHQSLSVADPSNP